MLFNTILVRGAKYGKTHSIVLLLVFDFMSVLFFLLFQTTHHNQHDKTHQVSEGKHYYKFKFIFTLHPPRAHHLHPHRVIINIIKRTRSPRAQ